MPDVKRLLGIRDELADMAGDPLLGFDAETSDRGYDALAKAADFVMRLPDGTAWEVQVTQIADPDA